MMKALELEQRKLLAEFLSNLSLAVITVGAIAPLFELEKFEEKSILKFISALITGIIIMVTGLKTLKK